MKQLTEAIMWVGVIGFICWGMVSCTRIADENQFKIIKLYSDKGYHQDGFGMWKKDNP